MRQLNRSTLPVSRIRYSRLFTFLIVLCLGGFFTVSCNSSNGDNQGDTSTGSAYDRPAEEPAATEATADNGMGVGPVTSPVDIPATIDKDMAEKGHALFESKCTACHNATDERKVGPGLKGVTERRKPEWIMNMIMNPSEMTQKDPTAKELLATYMTQMANQSLNKDEARTIVEYFRQNDAQK